MADVRRARRAASAGFTLIELMVVVVMISIIALIATPAMRIAREDRLAFDFARRTEQMIHRGRSRAAGRGAAHLMIAAQSGAPSRGKFLLFEALDGTAAPAGPNPLSSCKATGEWAEAATFAPGTIGNNARIVDGFDNALAATSSDIRAVMSVGGVASGAIAICVTPGGLTFVGQDSGGSVAAAIADMQSKTTPFNSFMDITFSRYRAGAVTGLQRHVLFAGSAAPRIKSE